MSKPLILLSFVLLVAYLSSCKKDSKSPQTNIAGKWNLEKFNSAQYVNGQLQVTPPLLTVIGSIQFNNNGTFIDSYSCNGVIDTTRGSYNLSGAMLSFSDYKSKGNGPTGDVIPSPLLLFFGDGLTGGTVSITEQITQIASNNLTIHTELTCVYSPTNTYKEVLDEYYNR